MRRPVLIASALLVATVASPLSAKTIYVDNRVGLDVNDGTAPTITGILAGPVRSLERARVLIAPGDVVEIANTGVPYYDSLRLIGGRRSGVASVPTVINGNGAVIDGSDPVDPVAWEPLGGGLWRLETAEKGWYRLVRGEVALPEVPAPDAAAQPDPPRGRWAAWRGAIYYRAEPDEIPMNEPYRIATREAGVFFYGVHDVVVSDLTVRHFRLDGVNAHDQVRDVVVRDVTAESNGRAGFFVGGSAAVTISGGAARGNREASLLLRELGKADVRDAVLDTEPVVGD